MYIECLFLVSDMTKEVIMDSDGRERKMSVPIICHDSDGDSPDNKLFNRRRQLRESEGIQLNNLHPLGHGRSCSFRNRPRPKLLNVDIDRPRRSSLPSPSANLLTVHSDNLHSNKDISSGQSLQRVRSFKTTSKGGIVNRGDSFKKSTNSINSQGSVITSDYAQNRQRENSIHSKASTGESVGSSAGPTVYKVAIIGDKGVGKASLTNQFMTSEFVAFDNDNEQGKPIYIYIIFLCIKLLTVVSSSTLCISL